MVWSVIIGGGVGILCVMALLVGQVAAQEAAWRAIARERRELDRLKRAMVAAAETGECPVCRLRRSGDL